MHTRHRSRRLERQYLNVTGEAERRPEQRTLWSTRLRITAARLLRLQHVALLFPAPAALLGDPSAVGGTAEEDAGGDLRSQQGLWAGQQIVGAGEGLSEDRVMPGGEEQPRDVGVEETGLGRCAHRI